MSNTSAISSGQRKYSPIWSKLKLTGSCTAVTDSVQDTLTVINGVKKEKMKDKNKPKKRVLDIKTEEIKDGETKGKTRITFRLIEDTSINNL